ncbi:MAG: hypothetical protein HOV79_22890 [Hamadaea sp.]|nr:hypothetical protein [Hamadaea sp.]
MHDLFADWHRAGGLDPAAVDLDKRWKAIETLADKPAGGTVVALTRLAHRQEADADALATVQAPFKKEDATFAMRGNAHELAVLSGAVLIRLLEARSAAATFAAYATLSASWTHGAPLVEDLTDLAGRYVIRNGGRARRGLDQGEPGSWRTSMQSMSDKVAWGGSYTYDFAPLRSYINQVVNGVDRAFRASEEQADIMWWLLSGGQQESSSAAKVIVFGARRLATLVRELPGPPATDELLRHHFDYCETDEVSDTELRRQVAALCAEPDTPPEIRDLLPLTAGGVTLPEASAEQLMAQVHREELLVRAWQAYPAQAAK